MSADERWLSVDNQQLLATCANREGHPTVMNTTISTYLLQVAPTEIKQINLIFFVIVHPLKYTGHMHKQDTCKMRPFLWKTF